MSVSNDIPNFKYHMNDDNNIQKVWTGILASRKILGSINNKSNSIDSLILTLLEISKTFWDILYFNYDYLLGFVTSFQNLETKVDNMDNKLNNMDNKLKNMDNKLINMEKLYTEVMRERQKREENTDWENMYAGSSKKHKTRRRKI
jgi:hypothetical protein